MSSPRFISGSLFGHITVMTFTSAVGLMGVFLVDLADMFFLSMLGEVELASAIGYAGSILFFSTSVSIGLAITMSALVARAVGAGHDALAEQQANAVIVFSLCVTIPTSAVVWWFVPDLLSLIGAQGRALELASTYLRIVIPFMSMLMLGMVTGGVLRALGQANWAMWITLAGAGVNLVLDPIFIFALDMGVAGAATASAFARVAMAGIGIWLVFGRVGYRFRPSVQHMLANIKAIIQIAAPAMITNTATPVANAYVTAIIAGFGDGAVAGYAIVARIMPVAFGVVYSLSGAIGPIIGQNFGAGRLDRVRKTVREAIAFAAGFIGLVALALYALQGHLIELFSVTGDAAAMIAFFCTFTAVVFVFDGAQFVANATFNNLNRAGWSTIANWGKATLGTIPFVWLGAAYYGAPGALAGQSVGAALSGTIAITIAFMLTKRLERQAASQAAQGRLGQFE